MSDREVVVGVDPGNPTGDHTWFSWACPECGTRVSSRYLPASPETTSAGVLDEAALLDAALTTAILAMAGIPCGEPHDSDLRYAFGPDGSFAADLRAALRGSGRE